LPVEASRIGMVEIFRALCYDLYIDLAMLTITLKNTTNIQNLKSNIVILGGGFWTLNRTLIEY
jgi:hypothetical protein